MELKKLYESMLLEKRRQRILKPVVENNTIIKQDDFQKYLQADLAPKKLYLGVKCGMNILEDRTWSVMLKSF